MFHWKGKGEGRRKGERRSTPPCGGRRCTCGQLGTHSEPASTVGRVGAAVAPVAGWAHTLGLHQLWGMGSR